MAMPAKHIDFGFRVARIARRLRQAVDAELRAYGLTEATWRPLAYVGKLGGGVRQKELASALSMFGRAMGSQIVAEGVESEAELDALRRVGVTKVQGYLTGRPMPLADAVQLVGVKSKALRKRA